MQTRLIQDNLYGQLEFEPLFFEFIDTQQFQRLRNVLQLGVAKYVYPNAVHSRFSHSLGTSHMALSFLHHLDSHGGSTSKRTKNLVQIAGLCHDLGHGPFSHHFDNYTVPKIVPALSHCHDEWTHEDRSCTILENIIDSKAIEIDKDEMNFIKNLILSQVNTQRLNFVYEIIANEKNGIDVDKFDYIRRDSYQVGFNTAFSADRLIKQSRVIDEQICYRENAVHDIYELYKARQNLYRNIYMHKTVEAIDFMLADVIASADSVFHLKRTVRERDIMSFLKLDDNILSVIKNSNDCRLNQPKEILRRLDCRDLYKMAKSIIIDPKDKRKIEKITSETVSSYCNKARPDDIIVSLNQLGKGFTAETAISKTKFYGENLIPKSVGPILSEKVNGRNVKSTFVRCFSKTQSLQRDIKEGFERLINERGIETISF